LIDLLVPYQAPLELLGDVAFWQHVREVRVYQISQLKRLFWQKQARGPIGELRP
jgi:hypothetical protein